ncbi:MAG TPA: type III pantothenate kinase [Rhodanobacteraceae bacterium]|nr:type III pantothenate kinase [Rhodanobacteraceae bacterium]
MNGSDRETWLFDLGNSRAKAARLRRGGPAEVFALDWERPDFAAALHEKLARWPRPARAWVASVASAEHAGQVREALAATGVGRIEWPETPRRAGGVVNRYAKPGRLGIDRFLAMLAARARAAGASVVVGCGTALTLDVVAADGRHAEGMIALSPEGMLQALRGATAIADGNPDAFADGANDDTAAALQAGCWASAGALVEWFVARGRRRDGVVQVWLHGGWAGRLAEWLVRDGCPVEVLEHAVLHGLAVWAGEAAIESADPGR